MKSALLVAAIGVFLGGPRPLAQQVFKSEGESVLIDVRVATHGRQVRGLSSRDFKVIDNGQEQAVQLLDVASVPIDLYLLVDTGAVDDQRDSARFFPQMRSIAALLDSNDRLGAC